MADFNENGVFGGVEFNRSNNIEGNSSFFETGNQNNKDAVNQNTANSIFGNYQTTNNQGTNNLGANDSNIFQPIGREKAIAKQGLWSKVKAFLFQKIDLTAPIKVELTPYQQKVEDEINEFLHQEVSFKGIVNFFKGKE